jgi:hypothetical protein
MAYYVQRRADTPTGVTHESQQPKRMNGKHVFDQHVLRPNASLRLAAVATIVGLGARAPGQLVGYSQPPSGALSWIQCKLSPCWRWFASLSIAGAGSLLFISLRTGKMAQNDFQQTVLTLFVRSSFIHL